MSDPFRIEAKGPWESVPIPQGADYDWWFRRDSGHGDTDEIRGNGDVPEWIKGEIIQARQSLRDFSMEGKIVPVKLSQYRDITLGRGMVGISTSRGRFRYMTLSPEEAVLAARAILEYYGDSS